MLIRHLLLRSILPQADRFVKLIDYISYYVMRSASKVANMVKEPLTQSHTVLQIFVS